MLPFPAYIVFALVIGYATVFGCLKVADLWEPPKLPHRMLQWETPVVPAEPSIVPVMLNLPCAPVWCEGTRRWRDPVTKRFVKNPSRMEASAQ